VDAASWSGLWLQLVYEVLDELDLVRKSAALVFVPVLDAAARYIEYTGIPRDQLDVDPGQRLANGSSQTGRSGLVVSTLAVLDHELHCHPSPLGHVSPRVLSHAQQLEPGPHEVPPLLEALTGSLAVLRVAAVPFCALASLIIGSSEHGNGDALSTAIATAGSTSST
jgi:hypothetical protein